MCYLFACNFHSWSFFSLFVTYLQPNKLGYFLIVGLGYTPPLVLYPKPGIKIVLFEANGSMFIIYYED